MLNSLATENTDSIQKSASYCADPTPKKNGTRETDALVLAHKHIVRRTAWHVHSRMSTAIEVEDLMQIGLVALVEAAQIFEERGAAFVTYANTRIRGSMIDALRRDARMSRSGMGNRRKIAAIRADLEQRLMRAPNDSEMAAEMGLGGAEYQALVATTRPVRQDSIDDAYSDHDMLFSDASDRADDMLEKSQLSALLAANLSKLSEREQMVLNLYFVEEMNLEEIGLTLDVGAARICQIKKSALTKLHQMM